MTVIEKDYIQYFTVVDYVANSSLGKRHSFCKHSRNQRTYLAVCCYLVATGCEHRTFGLVGLYGKIKFQFNA